MAMVSLPGDEDLEPVDFSDAKAIGQWKQEGNARLKEGDKAGALECYSRGLRAARKQVAMPDAAKPLLNGLISQLHSNRAHVLLKLERNEEAIEDCQLALEADEQNCKAYWRGATAALSLGRRQVAAMICRQGLEAVGDSAELRTLLAKAEGRDADSGAGAAQGGASVEEWERAAAEGDASAQYNLGMAYFQGSGVAKDMTKGLELWQQAADQGHERAQLSLSALLQDMQAEQQGKGSD